MCRGKTDVPGQNNRRLKSRLTGLRPGVPLQGRGFRSA
jgi:hypothetical protein